jgi:hypothetical protein
MKFGALATMEPKASKDNSWHSESDLSSFHAVSTETINKETWKRKIARATLFPYRLAWKGVSWSMYPVGKVFSWKRIRDRQNCLDSNLEEADHLFAELVPRPPEDVYAAQRQSAINRWLLLESPSAASSLESVQDDSISVSKDSKEEEVPKWTLGKWKLVAHFVFSIERHLYSTAFFQVLRLFSPLFIFTLVAESKQSPSHKRVVSCIRQC